MTEENLEPNKSDAGPTNGVHPAAPTKEVDPALKSLADALQVSFKLLSFIMVLFVVLFLATGIESIEPNEKGIVKVFGKVTGVAEPGLEYNWPFPIGEIEIVKTQERRMTVENFWMFETAEDKLRDLAQRRRENNGLRPGWDGYLLTGDRNLIHIKFVCAYQVQDPLAFKSSLQKLDDVMRSVLCDAAIKSAATRTADAMQADPSGFLDDVKTQAQIGIDTLVGKVGAIRINSVLLPQTDAKTWPLAAFTAYEQAQNAKSEKQTRINQAIAKAKGELIGAVGAKNFEELVGQPWNNTAREQARMEAGEAYNLIGQYSVAQQRLADAKAALAAAKGDKLPQARENQRQNQAEVDSLWKKINIVLTRTTIGGEASKIIAEAESEKTNTIQSAERRAKRFEELYAQYKKAPEVFLVKMWADVQDEVFNAPTVVKVYAKPGQKGMVVNLNNDPKIIRELRNYQLKQGSKKNR